MLGKSPFLNLVTASLYFCSFCGLRMSQIKTRNVAIKNKINSILFYLPSQDVLDEKNIPPEDSNNKNNQIIVD